MCESNIQFLNISVELSSRFDHIFHHLIIELVVLLVGLLPFPSGVLPRRRNDIADLSSVQSVLGKLLDVVLEVNKVLRLHHTVAPSGPKGW